MHNLRALHILKNTAVFIWRGMEDTVILYFGVGVGFLFVLFLKLKNNCNSLYVATRGFLMMHTLKALICLFGVMV